MLIPAPDALGCALGLSSICSTFLSAKQLGNVSKPPARARCSALAAICSINDMPIFGFERGAPDEKGGGGSSSDDGGGGGGGGGGPGAPDRGTGGRGGPVAPDSDSGGGGPLLTLGVAGGGGGTVAADGGAGSGGPLEPFGGAPRTACSPFDSVSSAFLRFETLAAIWS
jgi:hypothetical protein